MTNLIALPSGTELVEDFRIDRVLGAGGFGITYLADEIALARAVTIKEYFPSDFASRAQDQEACPKSQDCAEDYRWGLDRFIEEAQTLARFNHPNIVRVYRYFRANNTGYMVLHFEEGQSLKAWLKGLGRAPRQKELDRIIAPLLDALTLIHNDDFLHRDIAPDNIIIRKDGAPVLIDFGSARGEMLSHSKTVSALVKPGYSPYEQYAETSKQQGPWTDIYALAATLYHAVAGRRPPDSPSRMVKDEIVSAREAALSSYRPRFLKAIDWALTLPIDGRPQSIAAWRGELLAEDPAPRRSWIGGGRAAKKKDVVAEQQPIKTVPIPPQPDAPGPSGGLLDFVDRLKDGSADKPAGQSFSDGGDVDVKSRPGGNADAAQADAAAPAAAVPAAKPAGTVKLDAPPRAFVFPRLKKKKPEVPPAAEPVQERAEPAASPEEPASAPSSKPASKPRTTIPRIFLPAPVPAANRKRKPPRPSSPRRWRSWVSIIFKLLVGAGIAGVAVANQDKLNSFDMGQLFKPRPEATTDAPAAPPPPATAKVETPSEPPPVAKSAPSTETRTHTAVVRTVPVDPQPERLVPANPLIAQKASVSTPATAIAFSDDGRTIITAGRDGSLSVHDAQTGDILRTITIDHGAALSLDISGDRIATGHEDGHVGVWNIEAGTKVAGLHRNEASIWSLAFTGEPGRLVTASHDWKVSLWDIGSPAAPIHVFDGHDNSVQALSVSKRLGLLASGGADKRLRLWNLKTLDPVRTYSKHRDFISATAFRPDGRYVASGALDGEIRIWSTSSRRMIRRLRGHKGAVTSLAFSPDGLLLASSSRDGTIRIWSIKSRRTLRTLASHSGEVASLAFSPDGHRIASTGDDGSLRLWSVVAAVGQ